MYWQAAGRLILRRVNIPVRVCTPEFIHIKYSIIEFRQRVKRCSAIYGHGQLVSLDRIGAGAELLLPQKTLLNTSVYSRSAIDPESQRVIPVAY